MVPREILPGGKAELTGRKEGKLKGGKIFHGSRGLPKLGKISFKVGSITLGGSP